MHTVDSTHHPTGPHALWHEVNRLRRLLRDGERLAFTLERLALAADCPETFWAARRWREETRREVPCCES